MLTLSKSEISVLVAARSLLDEVENRCVEEYSKLVPTEDHPYGTPDGMDYGRLAEAADHAEEAIFNVLNIAKHYTHVDTISDETFSLK